MQQNNDARDLEANLGNNLDLRIEGGSALPVSKAAKQALIMDMMKLGFIKPEQGLEVMDMGGINKVYEQLQVDQRQAQRENLRMSKVTPELMQQYQQSALQQAVIEQGGQLPVDGTTGLPIDPSQLDTPLIVPVNTWDNHEAHIKYHNNFRKGQAFESLSEEVKQLFEQHVNQHLAALGLESVTLNPMNMAGVDPSMMPGMDPNAMMLNQSKPEENSAGQPNDQTQQQQQPGPAPMPQLEGDM